MEFRARRMLAAAMTLAVFGLLWPCVALSAGDEWIGRALADGSHWQIAPELLTDEPAVAAWQFDSDLAAPETFAAPPETAAPERALLEDHAATYATEDTWSLQVLPEGLIYRSYLAGVREPRFASAWVYEDDLGALWDVALGARVGIWRYGTRDAIQPEGWQFDIEGAAFPRLDCDEQLDVVATDYRFGLPLTYGIGRMQTKFAFYHISSHLGDEWMETHPGVQRINFSRNAFVWGNSIFVTERIRLYGEAGWAFDCDGGNEPWEFQLGADILPPGPTGSRGAPFVGLNSHLRQEVNFGGNLSMQAGWLWRGESGHMFRAGMQYYAGKSEQYSFYNDSEHKLGLGLWYDF